MARTTERLCISLPIEIANELRTAYPHQNFSMLCVQLIEYAHAAGFMKRLNDIDPADYQKQLKRSKQIKAEVEALSSDDDEEFGS